MRCRDDGAAARNGYFVLPRWTNTAFCDDEHVRLAATAVRQLATPRGHFVAQEHTQVLRTNIGGTLLLTLPRRQDMFEQRWVAGVFGLDGAYDRYPASKSHVASVG
jgi:hypothetical protein